MIRNIVLDIGNVLVDWRPQEWLARRFGPDLAPRLYAAAMGSAYWREHIDLGYRSEAEIFRHVMEANPDLVPALRELQGCWYEIFSPIPGSGELAQRLKEAGLKLYYLSNFPREGFLWVRERTPVFRLMDGGVASWQVHLCKPGPGIYRALLTEYGLVPGETVFADDLPENVRGAEALGIWGHCHTTPGNLELYLKEEHGLIF